MDDTSDFVNSSAQRPVILVVDDEPKVVKMCVNALESAGYAAVQAHSGEEALNWLDNSPAPDLIVSDIIMPGVLGIEVARHRLLDPRLADVPIVLMTNHSSDLSRPTDWTMIGGRLRVDTWLFKPFDEGDLLAAVEWNLSDRTSPPPKVCRLTDEAALMRFRLSRPGGQAEEARRHRLWPSLLLRILRRS